MLLRNVITSFKSSANATYISKRRNNEIIKLCKKEIQETTMNKVKEAKYFAVIFGEITNISATEQPSLELRYLKIISFEKALFYIIMPTQK